MQYDHNIRSLWIFCLRKCFNDLFIQFLINFHPLSLLFVKLLERRHLNQFTQQAFLLVSVTLQLEVKISCFLLDLESKELYFSILRFQPLWPRLPLWQLIQETYIMAIPVQVWLKYRQVFVREVFSFSYRIWPWPLHVSTDNSSPSCLRMPGLYNICPSQKGLSSFHWFIKYLLQLYFPSWGL